MKHTVAVVAIFAALFTLTAAIKSPYTIPDCASHCWTNSKYVSTCTDDSKCLCEDDKFQSAVFQCLYTQCQTNHFGPALHYALSECTDFDGGGVAVLPHLIRQQGLMKRENYDAGISSEFISESVSGYRSVYSSGSAASFVTTRRPVPVSGSPYPRTTQMTTFSTPPPNSTLTIEIKSIVSTPTLFALSPTTPVITATPGPAQFDTTGP